MDKNIDRIGERDFCWESYVPSRRYIYGNPADPDCQFEEWTKAVERTCAAAASSLRRWIPSQDEINEAKQEIWAKVEDGLLQSWGMRARQALGGELVQNLHRIQMHGHISLLISEWGVEPWSGSFLALANYSHGGNEGDFEEWAECAALLARHGVDIDAKGSDWGMERSPLEVAMSFGLPPRTQYREAEILALLSLGSAVPRGERALDGGPCVLEFALRRGMLLPALKMLDMGATLPRGESILAAACVSGNTRLAAELISRGFDPEENSQWVVDDGKRGVGHWASPLELAKGGGGGSWTSPAVAEVFEASAEQSELLAEVGQARKARAARI